MAPKFGEMVLKEINEMRKLTRLALVAAFTFGMFFLSAGAVSSVNAQGRQDFTLVNKTGVEIYALYVSPHSSNDWGEDILGVDTMAVDDELDITFSRREKAKWWDLRVEDSEGNFIEWGKINLLEVSEVTLYYKNGKATAILK